MYSTFADNQKRFTIRCEWGSDAIEYLYDSTDVFVIVDVLSFSTCVEVATSCGALVLPYKFKDESARDFAESQGATLAVHRSEVGLFSLSPSSMFNAEPGMKIVLPSPNGALLSTLCKAKITLCGSLRNAKAVAMLAQQLGEVVTIVPAGERWPNGNIRFALEDALAAGAILTQMNGAFSPEAIAFKELWHSSKSNLYEFLLECTSGYELITRDSLKDIEIASMFDTSANVPILMEGLAYQAYDHSMFLK